MCVSCPPSLKPTFLVPALESKPRRLFSISAPTPPTSVRSGYASFPCSLLLFQPTPTFRSFTLPSQVKEWEDQIDPTKKVYVKNFTLTEILSSRTSTSVLAALNRMVAKLTYLGFSVRRLHSDRAAELSSKAVTRWAEQKEIFRTFTSGSDWKSNGRVEAEIGMLKRAANIVMKSSCVDPSYWPLVFSTCR